MTRPPTTPAATDARPGTPKTRPVASGERSRTSCRYSVSMKIIAGTMPQVISPA
jgi:hypothetical protein